MAKTAKAARNRTIGISFNEETLATADAYMKDRPYLENRSEVIRDWGRVIAAMEAEPLIKNPENPMKSIKSRPNRGGFTLVELLAVVVIVGVLIALLLPAMNGAVRTARTAAASAEISTLGTALANFKAKYGVHPPSRVVLSESGDYSAATLRGTPGAAAIASRSVQYLRRIWPKMRLGTSGAPGQIPGGWYDWDGDGKASGVHVLDGAECLAFFLGGLPVRVDDGGIGVVGFSSNPGNPALAPGSALGGNRSPSLFDFGAGRLIDEDGDGFPSYADALAGRPLAYFSAYEGAGYDPDDVNYAEAGTLADGSAVASIGCKFVVDPAGSPAPNPYTNGPPIAMPGTTSPQWMNVASFQILSAGLDGQYGIGGWYRAKGPDPLPLPEPKPGVMPDVATPPGLSRAARKVEADNVANFKGGRLGD